MSGLSHHPGKVAQGQLCRGFESRPLRQRHSVNPRLDRADISKISISFQARLYLNLRMRIPAFQPFAFYRH